MTELYINGMKADVGKDTVFSFNREMIDLNSPAAVRGAFSKTVDLPDTENNALIFKGVSDPKSTHTLFNPKIRTPFTLTVDGSTVQGYLRLGSISVKNGVRTYKCTLMAELGDFFYNLSFDGNGGKRTFASMWWRFTDYGGKVMPKEREDKVTVLEWNSKYITESWESMYAYNPDEFPRNQKQVITGAVTYQGVPANTDADKVLVKWDNLTVEEQKYFKNPEVTDGWVLTTAPREYHERETRDFKSWNIRPAVRCSVLFDTIADKVNNGGYEFIVSDKIKESPYYKDTWLILNTLDMEENGNAGIYSLSMDTLFYDGYFTGQRELTAGGTMDTTYLVEPKANVSVNLGIQLNRAVRNIHTSYLAYYRYDGQEMPVYVYGGFAFRLRFEYDGNVSYSNVTLISSKIDGGKGTWGYKIPDVNHRLANIIGCNENDISVEVRDFLLQKYENVYGKGSFINFEKPITLTGNVPHGTDVKIFLEVQYVQTNSMGLYLPMAEKTTFNRDEDEVFTPIGYTATITLDESTEGVYSAVKPSLQKVGVTKKTLFSDAITPYEFITGFARMLNLRFLCDNGTVRMVTMDEFYTGETQILDGQYDVRQEMTVNPIPFTTKYFKYSLETAEGLAYETYLSKTDTPYGSYTKDTGYCFNNDTTEALDGVKFKGAIPYRLKSPWVGTEMGWNPPVSVNSPTFQYTDTGGNAVTQAGMMIKGLATAAYDTHPKLCMFDNTMKTVKATGVLAFLNHYQPLKCTVTDALEICQELNGGNQCHIWSTDGTVNTIVDRIPCFSRYLQDFETGVYTHSLDFGKPEYTFVGDSAKYGSVTLHDNYWRAYLDDLYNPSQCKVSMKVYLRGGMDDIMRKFYYFDGCMWTISALKDYRLNGSNPQQVEFVKVMDKSSYTSNELWWTKDSLFETDDNKYPPTRGVPDNPVTPDEPVIPDNPDNPSEYSNQYLTFEFLEDSRVKFKKVDTGTWDVMQYSEDNGVTWLGMLDNDNRYVFQAGAKVLFKSTIKPLYVPGSRGIGCFSTTGKFKAYGNTMSLLYGDDFRGKTVLEQPDATFAYLFNECTTLTDARNLVLPATALGVECYMGMFNGCTNLTAAPELPATTLGESCYSQMFSSCTSLTTAPSILPALNLADYCYSSMFSLCTSLTTAPELPATILAYGCYNQMFDLCASLNHITMLATDISADWCLFNWVRDVSSTGTFVKHPDMDSLPDGVSGIPEGWTVEDCQ